MKLSKNLKTEEQQTKSVEYSLKGVSKLEGIKKKSVSKKKPYPWYTVSAHITSRLPEKEVRLIKPGKPAPPAPLNWISILGTPIGMIAVVGIMYMMTGSTYSFYMIAMSVIGVFTSVLTYISQKKKQKKDSGKVDEEYDAYLQKIDDCDNPEEKGLQQLIREQQEILTSENPSLDVCIEKLHKLEGLWERQHVYAESFMNVRLGTGRLPSSVTVTAPENEFMENSELVNKAKQLARKRAWVENVPVTTDLKDIRLLTVAGSRKNAVNQVRSMLLQAAAHHSYLDLKIMLLYPSEEEELWSEFRWLPHSFDDLHEDRYMACTEKDAARIREFAANIINSRMPQKYGLQDTVYQPYYLLVITDLSLVNDGFIQLLTKTSERNAFTAVMICETAGSAPVGCTKIIEVENESGRIYSPLNSGNKQLYVPDVIDDKDVKTFCREMAPIRLRITTGSLAIPARGTLFEGMKISEADGIASKIEWRKGESDFNRGVPIGFAEKNLLYFKEFFTSHGLFIGSSGSGKSSLIRSMILSMAMTYSPEDLNFVFIDYKNPGLCHVLEDLPHCAGRIKDTDRERDISRKIRSLRAEIAHRQQLYNDSNVMTFLEYRKKYLKGEAGENMPFLFVVVDELAALKALMSKDDIDFLDDIYGRGRSLGVCVISGSQNTEPFTDKMYSNALYRFCCRTTGEMDSRKMIDSPAAYNIKVKGRAFLKGQDNDNPVEFQPFFCDGGCTADGKENKGTDKPAFVQLNGEKSTYPDIKKVEETHTQASIAVDEIRKAAQSMGFKPAKQVWCEPLPAFIPELSESPKPASGIIAVPALADDPDNQCQYPLVIDIMKEKNIVIYGAPQVGKTVFLKSILLSLLKKYSPEELVVYIIDNNQNSFGEFSQFPQVAMIGNDDDSSINISRAIAQELYSRQKKGTAKKDPLVLCIVDNIHLAVKAEGVGSFIGNALVDGVSHGIQFIVSGLTGNFPYGWEGKFSTKYCLYLSDKWDTYRSALQVEYDVGTAPLQKLPGRGVVYRDERLCEFQVSVPTCPGKEVEGYIAECAAKASAVWKKTDKAPENIKSLKSALEKVDRDSVLFGVNPITDEPVSAKIDTLNYVAISGRREQAEKVMSQLYKQFRERIKIEDIVFAGEGCSDFDCDRLSGGSELDTYFANNSSYVNTHDISHHIFMTDNLAECFESAPELAFNRLWHNFFAKGFEYGNIVVAAFSSVSELEKYKPNLKQFFLNSENGVWIDFTDKPKETDSNAEGGNVARIVCQRKQGTIKILKDGE